MKSFSFEVPAFNAETRRIYNPQVFAIGEIVFLNAVEYVVSAKLPRRDCIRAGQIFHAYNLNPTSVFS